MIRGKKIRKKTTQQSKKVVLETQHLSKVIDETEILKDITLKIYEGEKVALVGESGAGKTSLLQILGLLDTFTSGELLLKEQPTIKMSDAQKTNLRLHDIGFVYQFHHLIEELSVRENLLTPLYMAKNYDTSKILALVEHLGLSHLLDRMPHTLSGGEKQRISVLRSIANFPWLLLADEPTGNLDSINADIVMNLFLELADQYHMTLIIVTHNLEIAQRMDRIIYVRDGYIAAG